MAPHLSPGSSRDPHYEGELFRVHRARCGQAVQAVCEIWSHPRGWELRLTASDGEILRSETWSTRDESIAASDRWRASMVERGWT
jgi:hypothetical protein